MHKLLTQMLNQIKREHAKRRKRHVAVLVLSLFVASGVLWQLKITGITMTGEALCGYLEHQHTAECVEEALICGLEEAEPHTHTEECLGENRVLVCGQEEAEPHTHSEACLGDKLVCGLEEAEPHTHTEECLVQRLTCGQEEVEPHAHTEECVEQRLTCGQEESEDHSHGPECYTAEYICGKEATEGHIHSDACYTQEYICGLEETEGHTHGPDCYVQGYICGLEETEGHTHSDDCYAQEYICGQEATEGHAHTEACYTVSYVCGHEEHVHSLLCYSDRNADLETSADWEATLPGLTGDSAADLVAVARSQIGYTESQRNYVVSDDGSTQRGYTRYGEWYGNPYGNWGAMFVSFCLDYAGHPASGLASSGVETMRLAAVSLGYSRDAGYLPNPGDLVFLDRDGNGAADGVAVVTGWNEESFTAVEGDYGDAVQELSYSPDNSAILTYAQLTQPDSASFMLLDDEDDTALTSETEETEETITVTYVIDNVAYTSDPGSEETHITVSSSDALETDGGLQCNYWTKNKYKVTGTGTVKIYTIPKGTSLYDNELSLPALSVTNIGSNNTYTYSGLLSWITADGQVCTQYTVLNENTTLYLSLYETGENYSLDYVCCADDNLSISYYLRSTSFKLGQSVAADAIPTRDEVLNSGFTSTTHNVRALSGWQLKVTETGEMVDFSAGMPITAAYAEEQYGNAIKVYAVWSEAEAELVTATFVNGETRTTVTLTSGTALGENLPDAPEAPEGQIFVGWQAEGADGTSYYATAETVIAEDTTFTAVFASKVTATFMNGDAVVATRDLAAGSALGELPVPEDVPEDQSFLGWSETEDGEYATADTVIQENTTYYAVFGYLDLCDVHFHDILPYGTEYVAEDSEAESISWAIPQGAAWQDWLADVAPLHDGALIGDCIWYTDPDKTESCDLTAPVPAVEELHLYTFSYRVELTMGAAQEEQTSFFFPRASAVGIEIVDGTLTLTLREGEKPTAADFVVDGVDYSLYTWTYTDSNGTAQTLNISSLIANGVTESITATSSGTLTGLTEKTKDINFYVCINNSWVLIKSGETTVYSDTTNNSDYLSAAQLEAIYGPYGFTADQLNSDSVRPFPHTNRDNNTIYTDRAPTKINGVWFSPILRATDGRGCDVYYVPGYTGTNNENKSNFTTGYTFYTVTISDPAQKVYTADTLPGVTYTLTGNTANVTVETPEGVSWQCVGQNGTTVTGTDNGNGTTTFTISGISQPYVISPAISSDEVMITYDIHLPGTPSDAEYGTPTIEGGSTYSTLVSGETYTVLAPSLTSYFYTSGKYLGEAKFLGWAVNGDTTNLVQPDDALNLGVYGGQTVTLTAHWSTAVGGEVGKTGSMVNFFVSLAALPEGTTSLEGSTSKDTFTTSVYTVDCTVAGSIVVNDTKLYRERSNDGTQYFVLGDTSIVNLNDSHTQIVDYLTAGYTLTGTDGTDYTYSATFPTDEQVLQTVRQMVASGQVITINGHTLTADELTSENFTIKWYVFKYDTSDGWHIDGYLVAKTGEMVVQKTFAGGSKAIDAIKSRYSINVAAVADQTGIVNTGCTLALADGSYNEATNTYTWKVPVDQFYNYTVTEQNYTYDENLYTTRAWYNVSNSNTDGQNTSGWTAYSEGVTVTGRGYNEGDSGRLTVAFLNTYTAPGTVILQKVDAATGNLMPGVNFTIAKEDDDDFVMYHQGGGSYSAESGGTATTTITTDYSGQAYLWIGGGTYTFQEQVPTGYDSPGTITAVLAGEPGNEYKVVSVSSITADDSKFVGSNNTGSSPVMIVRNYSRTIDLTVEKIWADGENKSVTIQLYRNGVAMGAGYTVTFDGTVDDTETTPWKCLFEELPLYADGGLAQYSIREEALGDFKYSEEYTDGYRYYDVTYSGMSYLDANGAVTADMANVATIALSVTNQRSTGALSIQKVDNNGAAVAGAEFWLYAVTDTGSTPGPVTVDKDTDGHNVLTDLTPVKTAISDSNGLVNFGNMDAGRYYLIEHAAPANYAGSDDLYLLVLTDSGTAMYRWDADSESWKTVSGNQVVNTYLVADLTIKKVDESGNSLTGARFELYKDNQKVTIDGNNAFDVDENGQLTFQNLEPGTYALRETGAPAGYYRLAEDIPFTVADGSITCVGKDGKWSFSGENNTFTITVTNVAGSELPHTGGMGTLYGTMVGLLMMAGSLYAILLRRKRERGAV